MESDSWNRIIAESKRHQYGLLPCDLYLGFEEVECVDDDSRVEFACPFCSQDFDVVGLCCHIDDEHPVEAKNGICPVCAARVGMDLVGHITLQHGNLFKMERRRKLRKGLPGSPSTVTLLKKELREDHFQSLLRGSAYSAPPSSSIPDPLLSSFIYNLTSPDSTKDVQPLQREENLISKCVDQDIRESSEPYLSDKDWKERARRSEFVQELVLSTVFRDIL